MRASVTRRLRASLSVTPRSGWASRDISRIAELAVDEQEGLAGLRGQGRRGADEQAQAGAVPADAGQGRRAVGACEPQCAQKRTSGSGPVGVAGERDQVRPGLTRGLRS